MGSYLISQLATMAAGYAVTKVAGILGQAWWGRVVLAAVRKKMDGSQARQTADAIDATPQATREDLAGLSADERNAINHQD